jgi:hypothetical protein
VAAREHSAVAQLGFGISIEEIYWSSRANKFNARKREDERAGPSVRHLLTTSAYDSGVSGKESA